MTPLIFPYLLIRTKYLRQNKSEKNLGLYNSFRLRVTPGQRHAPNLKIAVLHDLAISMPDLEKMAHPDEYFSIFSYY